MRTFQTRHRSLEQPHGMPGRPGEGDFINLGDLTQVVMIKGRNSLGWGTMVHGVRSVESSLLSHVRLDQLETKERWTVMVARRLAVPIFGYRWKLGSEWTRVSAGWALGFHQDGQFVIAASVDDEPRPVVVQWEAAEAWMLAEDWNIRPLLEQAAAWMLAEAAS